MQKNKAFSNTYPLLNLKLQELKRIGLTIIVVFLFHLTILSQKPSTGNPIIKNFSPAEYGASSQNWSITQDSRGVMFFGNTQAVLEFDGTTWDTYNLPNLVPVRSLDISPDGTLFIGAFANFGYLSVNKDGSREFVSLTNKIREEDHKEFNDIWRVAAVSSGTYFFTPNKIYCFSKDKITVIEAEMEAMFGFKAYDRVFVMLKNKGLAVIENNELISLPYTSVFNSDHRMYTLIAYYDEKILIGTRNAGFYTYDLKLFTENGKYNFKKKVPHLILKHLKSGATEYINKHSMYSATKINANLFAFGTVTGGIVLVGKNGNIKRIINTNNGLNNNCIYSLFADKSGNLWAGLQQGISHIDLSYPLTFFNEEYNGLNGFVTSTTMFNNELYVGTMSGVFKYPTNVDLKNGEKLEFIKKTDEIFEFWDFAIVKNNLFAVGTGGIYILKKGKFVNILASPASVIEKLKTSNDLLCIGHDEEFAIYQIKRKGKRISIKKHMSFEGIETRISEITEIRPGEIWLSTDFDGIYRVKYDQNNLENYEVSHLSEKNGLPTDEYNSVQVINNKIYIATRKGLYLPQYKKDSVFFIQDTSVGEFFSHDSVSLIQFIPYKDKFLVNSEEQRVGFLSKTKSNSFLWNNKFSVRFPSFYKVIPNNDLLNIYTSNGLYIYNLENKKDFEQSFNTIIRRVYLKNDSFLFYGNYYTPATIDSIHSSASLKQNNSSIKELEYKNNSLSFEFSSTFYEEKEQTKYSYFLEGFDENWSNPSSENKAVFTNIPPGDYVFKVKAINIYGTDSVIAEYQFTILPPFYRTIWAYLIYLVLFVLVIIGSVKLYSRQLKAKNKELERIVAERTAEITAQKEQLEFKNAQINDSISYARTIQRAMIPSKEIIDSFFDSFILNVPRDIVSGDFYWALPVSPNNKKAIIIAVVDCTGHGVPGAFMSMIAMSLLNNIVGVNRIYSPSLIIEKLNAGIKKALRQEETDNNDGMDLGIIFAEEHNEEIKVVFAGAKFPILIYRKNENAIEKIKGTGISVGGTLSRKKYEFSNHNLTIEKGDIMYLFSDGYRDQNNANRERFGSKKFGELILNIAKSDLTTQRKALENALLAWKGNEKQRDDIIVVGLKK
jgi:serine phosphatase RsbU (regulator of sigma subunit)